MQHCRVWEKRNELYVAWRLLFVGSGFERSRTDIWNVTKAVLKRTQISKVSVSVIDWETEWTSESDRSGSQRTGGNAYETDGRKKGVTEELKVQDQMKWVGLMNNIKVSAEEIILKNMVYVWGWEKRSLFYTFVYIRIAL